MLSKNIVASIPFYYDRLTWCVQKNLPIPTSETIFHICTDPIVYAVFTVHSVFLLFLVYFFQMFEHQSKWDWNRILVAGLSIYLGLPTTYSNRRLKNNAHCITLISIYFGGMLFGISIVTIIMKIFTSPIFNPQLKNIVQLIESEFSLIGNAFVYQKMSEQSQVMSMIVNNSIYKMDSR